MTGLRGRSLRRLEDERFLTGRGRYLDDAGTADALHAVFVRSPHAHAAIRDVCVAEARALPGIRAAWTLADLCPDPPGSLPCLAMPPDSLAAPARPALADRRVRHVGEAVAMVVAETRRTAIDAAESILVAYESREAVTDPEAALAAGAPLLREEAPGNLAYTFSAGDQDAVAEALAGAAHLVVARLVNNRLIGVPLEPRAAIGRYDAATGFDLAVSGQAVHALRDQLADAVFRVPRARMRVHCPDVGGGFGVKNCLYPEYVMLLWAARRLGRPVRWTASRAEDFCSTVHARDNISYARLGLDGAGRILALDVDTIANVGAALSSTGPGSATVSTARAQGGGYAVPVVHMRVRGAYTNTVPIDAYRGAGKPEANYLIERLLDLAAPVVGLNPVELRRRNFPRAYPHATAVGTAIEPGSFAANIDRVLDVADRAGFERRRATSEAAGKLRGMALTCFLETARGAPDEGAEIRFQAGGRVVLALGTQSNGQGHETSFPQVAADLLGLPVETFLLVQADTASVAAGNGHGGARSLHQGGAALVSAIEAVLDAARPVAARLLQASPDTLRFEAGRFHADARSVPLAEVVSAAGEDGVSLDARVWNRLDRITFPNGCHVAEVEVDPETGSIVLCRYAAVDDYGTVINPLLTVGQVAGGLAQGIGQALLEAVVHDEAGQLLTGSLMDYCLPRAGDLPNFEIRLVGVPSEANPLGVKGAGQAGAIGAPQAVVAAVLAALSPFGIQHIDMPLTPERVWSAIHQERLSPSRGSPAPGVSSTQP